MIGINGYGSGFSKLTVRTPQLMLYPANPTWQIDYLSIDQTSLVPEIVTITVDAAAVKQSMNGIFNFYYVILENGVYVPKYSQNMNLG